jgi:hypothetical protein
MIHITLGEHETRLVENASRFDRGFQSERLGQVMARITEETLRGAVG